MKSDLQTYLSGKISENAFISLFFSKFFFKENGLVSLGKYLEKWKDFSKYFLFCTACYK